VGARDEVGHARRASLLAELLGVPPSGTHAVDSGRVIWFVAGANVAQTLRECAPPLMRIEPHNPGWEVTAYRQRRPEQYWVHLLAHGTAAAKPSQLLLTLPEGIRGADASLWSDSGERRTQIAQEGCCLRISFPVTIPYLIVKVRTDARPNTQ
jgi:hypothetical protein